MKYPIFLLSCLAALAASCSVNEKQSDMLSSQASQSVPGAYLLGSSCDGMYETIFIEQKIRDGITPKGGRYSTTFAFYLDDKTVVLQSMAIEEGKITASQSFDSESLFAKRGKVVAVVPENIDSDIALTHVSSQCRDARDVPMTAVGDVSYMVVSACPTDHDRNFSYYLDLELKNLYAGFSIFPYEISMSPRSYEPLKNSDGSYRIVKAVSINEMGKRIPTYLEKGTSAQGSINFDLSLGDLLVDFGASWFNWNDSGATPPQLNVDWSYKPIRLRCYDKNVNATAGNWPPPVPAERAPLDSDLLVDELCVAVRGPHYQLVVDERSKCPGDNNWDCASKNFCKMSRATFAEIVTTADVRSIDAPTDSPWVSEDELSRRVCLQNFQGLLDHMSGWCSAAPTDDSDKVCGSCYRKDAPEDLRCVLENCGHQSP